MQLARWYAAYTGKADTMRQALVQLVAAVEAADGWILPTDAFEAAVVAARKALQD